MKRLAVTTSIILILAILTWLHVEHLDHMTEQLIDQLELVDECLNRENWGQAQSLARQVLEQWEDQEFYLHVTLRHADIDAIHTALKEVLAYLDRREDPGECLAATARLVNLLELLAEAEEPSLKNLL